MSGVAVMLVMIPFTRFISRKLAGIQRELMRVKDRRINTTSEALEGIKLIKLQAWELPFLRRIGEIRAEEMRVLRRWGRGGFFDFSYVAVQAMSTCLWNATPYVVSTFSFLFFVLLGNNLTTQLAFTSISL